MDVTTHSFVVIYSGRTVAEARIIAASSSPDLVKLAADKMLYELDTQKDSAVDAALIGQRYALNAVRSTAE